MTAMTKNRALATTKRQMSHTKTPWKVWHNNGVVTDDRNAFGVCEAPDPDDAVFIVKAVNAHDGLVAALKAFVDQLDCEEMGGPGLGARDWISHWEAMHEAGHKALKLAGAA